MDPATMAMLEEAAMTFAKDQAIQGMGPQLAAMGGTQVVGGLLGQTQATQMFNQTPAGTMLPDSAKQSTGVMDTLQNNVMSDINNSTVGKAYNTITNPNATAKDYTSLGYRFAFSPEAEADNKALRDMSPISAPYGGRVTTTGGIPELLKQYNYNPGLLQYLG